MLRARANSLIDSSNELIDELFRVESMIGCILQSGQVLIGSRRLWIQRDGQRGSTFDGKYLKTCQTLIHSSVNHGDQLSEAGFEVAHE